MNAVPDEHRQFIRELSPFIDEPDLIVAHAMWDIHERNDTAYFAEMLSHIGGRRHRLLWGRYGEEELGMPKAWTRPMFFGHTPVRNYSRARGSRMVPISGPGVVLLDTAAALGPGGRLTAFCAETGRFLQADPLGRLVAPEAVVEV
jgi:hypothetical protein